MWYDGHIERLLYLNYGTTKINRFKLKLNGLNTNNGEYL